MDEITEILKAVEEGNTRIADQLLPVAYLRFLNPDGSHKHWENRAHFFVATADAMRRILIENARRKNTGRRGGEFERKTWDEADYETRVPPETILRFHEALLGHRGKSSRFRPRGLAPILRRDDHRGNGFRPRGRATRFAFLLWRTVAGREDVLGDLIGHAIEAASKLGQYRPHDLKRPTDRASRPPAIFCPLLLQYRTPP